MLAFTRYALVMSFTACVGVLNLLATMANDYVEIGHGLHPAAAVAASVVVTMLGWASLRLAMSRDE